MHTHSVPLFRRNTRRKAISNVVSTILLVAIAIVAVTIVFGVVIPMIRHSAPSASIQITQADISGATGVITVTAQNTGSLAATGVTVNIIGPGGNSVASISGASCTPSISTTTTLGPGQSVTCTATSSSIQSGVTYSIQVIMSYTNGQTGSQTVDVTAT
ncbi:hypothetical protein B9Q03_11510 [Candidatus Marsarchaeota G2 archaeon OSP_D]|jgi:flagellin-like protein|uniref:CARDB domain-containing protein n=4 Tax=Candidatus Marsarchaeota group 2 TaxID=2203771 RepID=A0A2R6C7M8_9ARCH|nr:MAG: hypothetical protein B9Q03_11510 [Candidatus Marsarchaeota G2 archaeon OSP_D]PSN90344.1 MAG: hypothetical protein B9Q08_04910 [Candidatus Marsarchaeota G2 archaeon ECH_B_SAG-M15]PSN96542.1 MAG: hypothetical protein B9Q09_02120 [Candidatus Marsarchaeota G2 archaeon ECH_B_SAG-C16]PSO06838.1 MAG: hypothetical protein B9Q04_14000 [Candidatus Marsarchaeota G2 archaeon BE_D]